LTQAWRVDFVRSALRELNKLPRQDQARILSFIDERIVRGHPRRVGHPLSGQFAGLWSYRVGDFRLIARIEDRAITVVIVRIGNRREVYR
jgi:mRNA interferase RelE/StbE